MPFFCAMAVSIAYKIPYDVAPIALDGKCFHLKPLLPLFAYDREVFILVLSRNACDLLDLAAVQTILHGGEVFPVNIADHIPHRSPLAVLYRF